MLSMKGRTLERLEQNLKSFIFLFSQNSRHEVIFLSTNIKLSCTVQQHTYTILKYIIFLYTNIEPNLDSTILKQIIEIQKLNCIVQYYTCTILTWITFLYKNVETYLYSTAAHLYYFCRDNMSLYTIIETDFYSTIVHMYYSYRDNISLCKYRN